MPTRRPRTYNAVLFENDHVRVEEMVLKPGEMDEWQMHPDETVYFAVGDGLTIHVHDGGSVIRNTEANSQVAVERAWTAGNPEI